MADIPEVIYEYDDEVAPILFGENLSKTIANLNKYYIGSTKVNTISKTGKVVPKKGIDPEQLVRLEEATYRARAAQSVKIRVQVLSDGTKKYSKILDNE